MADQEREDSGPSLEMPTLGGMLRRRRTREEFAPQGEAAEPAPEPPAHASDPEPQAPPLFADEVATDDEVTAETPAAAEAVPARGRTAVAEAPTEVDPGDDEPEGGSRRARRRRGPLLAGLPPRLVVVVTGALVALLAVGLTYAGLVGCDAWRGTQTCGGPGLLFLALILAAMVVVGAFLLRAAGIADATSTSVLAVGLFAVVCLLVLIDALFSPWMVVVLPVVGALAYALAHWVTTTYGDAATRATRD